MTDRPAAAPPPLLRLQDISKRFGSLLANDAISLDLNAGEVLALLGENGAGKSTLVSILFGHYRADSGRIEVEGRPLAPGNPKAALAAGIGMVHQHFTLADNLTVLENVMLGSESLWQPFMRRAAARVRLLEVAGRFGLAVQPDAPVASLSVGERQRVEILKALYRGARILILDEPTAVLTPQEALGLFDTLAQMVAQGLAIVFISHKLDEVLRVSNRIAVLRAGRLVAQADAAATTQEQLAQWMVGQALAPPLRAPAGAVGAPVCVLEAVNAGSGREQLHEVSLTLRAGEITAIAGVSGNGQQALAALLCGTLRTQGGQVRLRAGPDGHAGLAAQLPAHEASSSPAAAPDGGRAPTHGGETAADRAGASPSAAGAGPPRGNENMVALRANPAWLVGQGVARIPEDRHGVGVIGDLPVWENAVAERLRTDFSVGPFLRRRAARAHAERIATAFDVRGGGPLTAARSLSGGNMQKLILGRALLAPDGRAPRLIVAHQPTWGLDIGAVAYVQQQLIAARDAGAAVLLISDDLDEVLQLGDRIGVIHAGRLTEIRPAADWSREAIGLAMAGADDRRPRAPDRHLRAPDRHPREGGGPEGADALASRLRGNDEGGRGNDEGGRA